MNRDVKLILILSIIYCSIQPVIMQTASPVPFPEQLRSFDSGTKPEYPEKTDADTGRTCNSTQKGTRPDSNRGPSICEMTLLTTTPPSRPHNLLFSKHNSFCHLLHWQYVEFSCHARRANTQLKPGGRETQVVETVTSINSGSVWKKTRLRDLFGRICHLECINKQLFTLYSDFL